MLNMSNNSNSPVSPSTEDITDALPQITIESFQNSKKVYRRLVKMCFINPTKVTDTLQGSIWRATKSQTNQSARYIYDPSSCTVIKVTNRYLHQLQVGIIGTSTYRVNEDILLEQSILKYLTQQTKCPHSIVKFHRFFKTNQNYYLVMEDGGSCLFDFVRNAHKLIRNKRIGPSEWRKVTHIMFSQIVECMEFIHSKNVVHFDISLENFLVNDIKIEVVTNLKSKKSRLRFVTKEIQVKLCDFGLAELFTKDECLSSKHAGKKQYKSPEVVSNKKQFHAKKNDIWCFGVAIFMIATGCPPWEIASRNDKTFSYVMHHSIGDLLKYWKIIDDVDPHLVDLLNRIFKYEKKK
eukprot:92334_1